MWSVVHVGSVVGVEFVSLTKLFGMSAGFLYSSSGLFSFNLYHMRIVRVNPMIIICVDKRYCFIGTRGFLVFSL